MGPSSAPMVTKCACADSCRFLREAGMKIELETLTRRSLSHSFKRDAPDSGK
jgi:hypothetical protein